MKLRVDPLTGMPITVNQETRTYSSSGLIQQSSGGAPANPFITNGTNGITTVRWQSTPSGNLFDMTIDDTGHVVTTAVTTTGGRPIGLLLALTYP